MNDVNAFKLNKDIEAQQDVIESAEKKNKNIAKDGESLLKDKSKIESKISKTNIEIGSLKSDMDNQQKQLEAVKAKTATIDQMDALKKEVSKQEDAARKSIKKYNDALKDAEDYKADLKKNEDEIAKNKKEQEDQIAEVKKQKEALDAIKVELSKIIIK
jgi:chromosome segregation ATPase